MKFAIQEGADIDASRRAAQASGLSYIHPPFDAKKPDEAVEIATRYIESQRAGR